MEMTKDGGVVVTLKQARALAKERGFLIFWRPNEKEVAVVYTVEDREESVAA